MNLSRNRNARLALGALAILTLIFAGIHHLATPLTGREVRWLVDGGRLASLADSWVGATSGDGWMRLPIVLVGSAAPLLVAATTTSSSGIVAGVAAGGLLAAMPMIALASRSIGSEMWAAVLAALAIALAASARPELHFGAGIVAAIGFLLQPPLAVVPAGAFVGRFVPLGKYGRTAGVAAVLAASGVVAVLVFGNKLPWAPWKLPNFAERAQQIALLIAALAVVARPLRPANDAPANPLLGAALGGVVAGLLFWLLGGAMRPAFVALAVSLAALAAAAPSRSQAPQWLLATAAAGALVAWATAGPWSLGGRPPIREIAAAIAGAKPPASEVLVGDGLSRGAVAHATHGTGLSVVDSASAPVVATVRMANKRPTPSRRKQIVEQLGDRMLARYGRDGKGRNDEIVWSLYQPIELSMAEGGARPNIAIISVDTLRADHLSAYGYGRETSPRLREWSRHARLYERAIAPAPSTAPSFASLLTGRLPSRHGVRHNYYQLDPGNWTLARILKRAGYDTGAFVSSWVLTRRNCGFEPGFDLYDEKLDDRETQRKRNLIRLASSLSASVRAWLDRRTEHDAPWFLWVHAIDPHGPYDAIAPFDSKFDTAEVRKLKPTDIPDYQRTASLDFYDYFDSYDEEVLQTDHYLGQLIEKIDSMKSPRGTIIVFVADHGEQMGEHGRFFEHDQSLHREEVHVPLVIKGLRVGGAERRREIVSLVDVVPTLLGELGIETNVPLDGMPLSARAKGSSAIYTEWKPGYLSIYRDPWKLVVDRRNEPQSERLYDLRTDWNENAPLEGDDEARRSLLDGALAIIESDPLHPTVAMGADRREWENLPAADLEQLRSLGYTGD